MVKFDHLSRKNKIKYFAALGQLFGKGESDGTEHVEPLLSRDSSYAGDEQEAKAEKGKGSDENAS